MSSVAHAGIRFDMLVKGSDLNSEQRKEVLARFTFRWTHENVNALGDKHPHPQISRVSFTPLISDEEWLQGLSFHIKADGSLSRKNNTHPRMAIDADRQEAEESEEGE